MSDAIEWLDLKIKGWQVRYEMYEVARVYCQTKINDLDVKVSHVYVCRSNVNGKRKITIKTNADSNYWACRHPVYKIMKQWARGELSNEQLRTIKTQVESNYEQSKIT